MMRKEGNVERLCKNQIMITVTPRNQPPHKKCREKHENLFSLTPTQQKNILTLTTNSHPLFLPSPSRELAGKKKKKNTRMLNK
jgi:hypothetical protein